jgi:tRNA A37 threonylcarbamoyladenosine biosynthesis protein TsaE
MTAMLRNGVLILIVWLLRNDIISNIHHMDLYRLPHGTDMALLGIPHIFSSCKMMR